MPKLTDGAAGWTWAERVGNPEFQGVVALLTANVYPLRGLCQAVRQPYKTRCVDGPLNVVHIATPRLVRRNRSKS